MADGRHIENRFFGHNSAANCPISVKFCVGQQVVLEKIHALHGTYFLSC